MGEDQQPRRVYSPHEVAERLGISDQRLRQLAVVYERVRGEFPRDQRGRVWPEEAIEDLERAREAVQEGRASGVEGALRGEIAPDRVDLARRRRRGPERAIWRLWRVS